MPSKKTTIIVWVCAVCGHEWKSKDNAKPLRCAGCKTPYWDTKRKPRHK